MRFQFKGKTPVWAPILTGLLLVNIFVQIAAAYWIPHWAPIQPDLAHSYQIRFRGGPAYFVQPWLGAYFDHGLDVALVLVGLFLVLLCLNRGRIERIP